MNKTIAVVTGATSGIGFEAAKSLLSQGAAVIGVGRSEERIERAKKDLLTSSKNADIEFVLAELSTGEGIEMAARGVMALTGRIDALLHAAGTANGRYTSTDEGYEFTFATNHLAPFRLTHALLPLLAPRARVITVSSNSHRRARVFWDDVMLRANYHNLRAYKQSKLCNVLFTAELARRFPERLLALTFDPGLARTEIGLKSSKPFERFFWHIQMLRAREASVAGGHLARMALDEAFSNCNGGYFRLGEIKRPDRRATQADAQRLWTLSARLSNIDEDWM